MTIVILFLRLPSIVCFTFAGLMAYNNISGWGLFLAVGVISMCFGYEIKRSKGAE